jgi:undecaprenyl diphosphate synthase
MPRLEFLGNEWFKPAPMTYITTIPATVQPASCLPTELDPSRLPTHIAIIMDGNGRWAEQRKMPRTVGHAQGARTLKNILKCCDDWGIAALTVYAFSTENWRRPLEEVNYLMVLCEQMLEKELMAMHDRGVKLQFLGDLTALPISLERLINKAIDLTQHNRGITFNVAMNYGSRAEIVKTCQSLATKVQAGEMQPSDIDEITFGAELSDELAPDLLIRTSGEMRLSNFLLWQLAYTELYFTDTLWVDFDRAALLKALVEYQSRQRRFGGLKKL